MCSGGFSHPSSADQFRWQACLLLWLLSGACSPDRPAEGSPGNGTAGTSSRAPDDAATASTGATTVPPPKYAGTPPPYADERHQLAPERYVPDDPATANAPLEVVYDLGYAEPSFAGGAIHVGEHFVYWDIAGHLMRGPKNGNGPVEEFGLWDLFGQTRLRGDATHVYWLNRDRLSRRPHHGGPLEDIQLPWDHTGGDFRLDDRYAYIAMPGCPAITRVDKQTLEQETLEFQGIEQPVYAAMILHEGQILCGSGGRLFVARSWESGIREIATHPDRMINLAVYNGSIYWFGLPGNLSMRGYMWRTPLLEELGPPREAERLTEVLGNSFTDFLEGGPDGLLIYSQAASTRNGSIWAYVPAKNEFHALVYRIGTGGGIDSDGDHYYFTQRNNCCVNQNILSRCTGVCCNACGAILRFSVDYLPPALSDVPSE